MLDAATVQVILGKVTVGEKCWNQIRSSRQNATGAANLADKEHGD